LAYPFIPLPSFDEFILKLKKKYKCEYKTFSIKLNGKTVKIEYFERSYYKKKIKCVVSIENKNDIIPPTLLRSICNRLKIDPKDFGLHLG